MSVLLGNHLQFLPRVLLVGCIVLLVTSLAHADSERELKSKLAPHQVWTIRSPIPTTAKVIIGRIETKSGKSIAHVSIIDIPNPSDRLGEGERLKIDHVPFDESALAASVDRLLATNAVPAPGFEGGYEHWLSDANAGVFEIDVAQAISIFVQSISRRRT